MSEGQLAALFAAPDEPAGEEQAKHADPLGAQDEDERELSRLRLTPINEIVLEYIGTRDHLDEKRHEFQAIERELKAKMTMMSMVLREKADSLGVDNFNIRGVGTAYRNTKTSYRVSDWNSYVNWLVQTGNFHCVEKRAAKLAVQEVHRNSGEVPPGLDFVQEIEFLVRRNA